MTHGRCPFCGKKYKLVAEGKIPQHQVETGTSGKKTCSGAGQPPRLFVPRPETVW